MCGKIICSDVYSHRDFYFNISIPFSEILCKHKNKHLSLLYKLNVKLKCRSNESHFPIQFFSENSSIKAQKVVFCGNVEKIY